MKQTDDVVNKSIMQLLHHYLPQTAWQSKQAVIRIIFRVSS